MNSKKCIKCEEVKPLSEFHKNKQSKDGYRPRCKACRSQETKETPRHVKDLKNEKSRERYSNPEFKAAQKIRCSNWYEKVKDSEEYKERRRQYVQDNSDKYLTYTRNRTKLKLENKGIFKTDLWYKSLLFFNGKCAYCGDDWNIQKDHITPLVKGGDHDNRNIVPCCKSCNLRKGDLSLEEWITDPDILLNILQLLSEHEEYINNQINIRGLGS